MLVVEHDGTESPLSDLISQSDIIVNGTFQDTDHPIHFVTEEESSCLRPGCLIIDVSCDEGMGFFFARPTTFKDPMLKIGTVDYYAVDHTPSYLWESASRAISAALIVYLPAVAAGRDGWQAERDPSTGCEHRRRRDPEARHPVVSEAPAAVSARSRRYGRGCRVGSCRRLTLTTGPRVWRPAARDMRLTAPALSRDRAAGL